MLERLFAAQKADEIKEQYQTSNIWEILDLMHINHKKSELGSRATGLKGYCVSFFEQYYLAVNQRLPGYLQNLIAWHELGHIVCDPELLQNGKTMCEYDPFHTYDSTEKRANYFAAEGYIDDTAFLDLLKQGYSLDHAAAFLCVPRDFVIYKAEILRANGVSLSIPERPDAFCLGTNLIGAENF